jgi:hypothetical protein
MVSGVATKPSQVTVVVKPVPVPVACPVYVLPGFYDPPMMQRNNDLVGRFGDGVFLPQRMEAISSSAGLFRPHPNSLIGGGVVQNEFASRDPAFLRNLVIDSLLVQGLQARNEAREEGSELRSRQQQLYRQFGLY